MHNRIQKKIQKFELVYHNPIARKSNKEQIDLQCLTKFKRYLKPHSKFESNVINENQTGISFGAVDHLELVDYTGHTLKEEKRGTTNQLAPSILKRLNVNTNEWLARTSAFEENQIK